LRGAATARLRVSLRAPLIVARDGEVRILLAGLEVDRDDLEGGEPLVDLSARWPLLVGAQQPAAISTFFLRSSSALACCRSRSEHGGRDTSTAHTTQTAAANPTV
jgi:hypothetical protein